MIYTVTTRWIYIYARPTSYSPYVGTLRKGDHVEGHAVQGATAYGSPVWIARAGGGYVSSKRVRAL